VINNILFRANQDLEKEVQSRGSTANIGKIGNSGSDNSTNIDIKSSYSSLKLPKTALSSSRVIRMKSSSFRIKEDFSNNNQDRNLDDNKPKFIIPYEITRKVSEQINSPFKNNKLNLKSSLFGSFNKNKISSNNNLVDITESKTTKHKFQLQKSQSTNSINFGNIVNSGINNTKENNFIKIKNNENQEKIQENNKTRIDNIISPKSIIKVENLLKSMKNTSQTKFIDFNCQNNNQDHQKSIKGGQPQSNEELGELGLFLKRAKSSTKIINKSTVRLGNFSTKNSINKSNKMSIIIDNDKTNNKSNNSNSTNKTKISNLDFLKMGGLSLASYFKYRTDK